MVSARTVKELNDQQGQGGGTLDLDDGDDQRIFGGLKFSIPGLFWEENLASIFLGGWIYEGILFGIQNNHKMHGIAACARCIVLQTKYHWTFLVILFNFLRFGNLAF